MDELETLYLKYCDYNVIRRAGEGFSRLRLLIYNNIAFIIVITNSENHTEHIMCYLSGENHLIVY